MKQLKSRTGMAAIAMALMAGLGSVAAHAQLINLTPHHKRAQAPVVEYLYPVQVHLSAGQPAEVPLHFRVVSGMHINSHTPLNGYLIPTTFSILTSSHVRLESANFPPGTDITLPSAPQTKLSVYTGEFVVEAHIVVSQPGNHLVQGKLRYQACTVSQCMPPETITAAFDVIAK
jgi:hypothetical protein